MGDNSNSSDTLSVVETPVLIVGAGPAGGSLACFLSHPPYSVTGMLISSANTTSQTPRAHITNPAAFECLRDVGLEDVCLGQATSSMNMQHTRWCHDMTGEEYARIHSWGNDPNRRGEYEASTPCKHTDLPQTLFEPIILNRAAADGWNVRFGTTFLSFETKEDGSVLSRVRDEVTKIEYLIHSKYLFGCDGAKSQVLRQLELPLIKKPGQGLAWNVLVKVDLSNYIEARVGNLHWVFQVENEYPDFAWTGIIRMVKPWDEWMFICLPLPDKEWSEPTREQWERRCREIVGRDDIPLEILDISKWYINEIVAEYYSKGNIFCLGDAVHRHPPFNGLGSNTCVQDAYNLAWKTKYVLNSLASPSLLSTYSLERQPVGQGVITRANQGIRDHTPVWDAMGLMLPTPAERIAALEELKAPTDAGRERRKQFNKAIEGTAHEFHGLGIEMNHVYVSEAVYLDDERKAGRIDPGWPEEDEVLYHRPSTFPGHRLPHAWLNRALPDVKHTSTHDLAGKARFSLFTSVGGQAWTEAAKTVGTELGLEINTFEIGPWGCEWIDVYRDWQRRREIEEDGCLLVRPDRFVAWRAWESKGITEGEDEENCEQRLRKVLKKILGR